jgi:hypothetical protein
VLTMYDSVDLSAIPPTAGAVAGYTNGKWPTYGLLAKRFPKALRLSIAVSAEADADCLDVEPLDATNMQAPFWFRRQKQLRPSDKPKFYTSLSNVMPLVGVLDAAGIKQDDYHVWSAHYTHTAHLCGPSCGSGLTFTVAATQYTDIALARNLDASLVSAGFFTIPVPVATRRRRLRAWILAHHKHGMSWAVLKKTSQWKLWRRLGGR